MLGNATNNPAPRVQTEIATAQAQIISDIKTEAENTAPQCPLRFLKPVFKHLKILLSVVTTSGKKPAKSAFFVAEIPSNITAKIGKSKVAESMLFAKTPYT